MPIVKPPIPLGKTLDRLVFEGGTHNETPVVRFPSGDTYELPIEEMRTYLKLIGVKLGDDILDTLWNFGWVSWQRTPELIKVKADPPGLAEKRAQEQLRKFESEGKTWTPLKI